MPAGAGADRSLAEHRRIAGHTIDVAIASCRAHQAWAAPDTAETRELQNADPDELRSIIIALVDRAIPAVSTTDRVRRALGFDPSASSHLLDDGYIATRILGTLATRRVSWTRGDALILLRIASEALARSAPSDEWKLIAIVGQPIAATERVVRDGDGGASELEAPIRELAERLGGFSRYSMTKAAQFRNRLLMLLDGAGSDLSVFAPGDTWGTSWQDQVRSLTTGQRALLAHLPLVTSVSPTQAWRKRAAQVVSAPAAGELLQAMLLDATSSRNTGPVQTVEIGGQTFALERPALVDANALIVRGAIWAAAILNEPWAPDALTAVGLFFGTSGSGSNIARDERLANAAAAALGTMTGDAAIAGLGRMKAKVTNRNVSKQIAKALEAAAVRAGITPSELLELAVPTQGLDTAGRRALPIGDHTVILAFDGDDASLSWQAPDGRVTARPPAAISSTQTAAISRVKEEHKELRKTISVERGRIEDLFVENREWAIADWQARYLAHPLTGGLARRLIWTIRDEDAETTVMPGGDGLVASDGSRVEAADSARVRLWHPIDATEATIAGWRTALLDRRVRQPFKQAFREVYIRTPAEDETEIYSNRFAGHILLYPQARALMTARRWGSNFLGPYDGGFNGIAKRAFPTYGLRAEFWHDAIETERMGDVTHCTTDQVRFIRLDPVEEPVPLRDVPPIVFSEAMRDVDLFVSVTSIGADRNWQDGGQNRNARFDLYWNNAWDAELTPTAKVRRDVIDRMLPGLAIADRLTLEERWLNVRGDLRTYRINLISGNIMMSPSDTYLCIVPARGGASDESVFLPFDDDLTLSVILSKAFMLASDTKITDRSILAQIRRG